MIKLFFLPVLIMLSCISVKPDRKGSADSLIKAEAAVKDTLLKNTTALPNCIQQKIDSFRLKEAHEMPRSVVEYAYKGKTVYYVTMPCCDFFNEVYDENCIYLGAPDGGFTGTGDGKLPDFTSLAKQGKTVWTAPGK